MDTIIVVGLVGSVASIIGAIIAFREAVKAKNSAETAIAVKNSISSEQRKISLSKLLTETKKGMGVSIKLTTPANPSVKIRGLDYQSSIQHLREFIDTLKENAHYIKTENQKSILVNYQFIETQLVKLANENDQQKKYEIGNDIHKSMGDIIRTIKPELDV